MPGIMGGGLADSATLNDLGTDEIPSGTGEVAGAAVASGFLDSPGARFARFLGRNIDSLAENSTGDGTTPEFQHAPLLDPKEANERFGIPGQLSFDAPITKYAARDLSDSKRAQIVRQDTINRRPTNVLTGQAAQFAYGFVGGALDPLSFGAALIPGVGEAQVAELLGRAGEGVAGRIAARAVAGASAGVAGTAALEPLNYALDQSEHEDWTMAQALRNIAFGGLLGGGLHVVGGAVGDRLAARRAAEGGAVAPDAPAPNPISERLEVAGPEARETLLQGALAQHVDGQPVRVADGLEAGEAVQAASLAARSPRLSEWTQTADGLRDRLAEREADVARYQAARDARNRGEAPDLLQDYATPAAVDASLRQREATVAALRGRLAAVEHGVEALRAGDEPSFQLRYDDPEMNRPAGLDAPGQMPQTLLSRIRELGGLQDSGGELAARDLHKTPGMVRASGMRLEDAAVRMAEEGYLPGLRQDMASSGVEQVDRIGALLDAVDDQRSGRPVLREGDTEAWDALVSKHEEAVTGLRMAAEHLGITEAEARGLSRGQMADLLQRRHAAEATRSDLDGLDDLPGWDEPVSVRSPAELATAAQEAMDRLPGLDAADPAVRSDDRTMQAAADRAPQVASTRSDAAMAEAQKAADAVLARVQTEVAAGRLPEGALAGLNDAAALAEGEARAHEAAAACMVARGII